MSFNGAVQQSSLDNAASAVAAAGAGSQLPGTATDLLAAQAVNPFDIEAIFASLQNPQDGTPSAAIRVQAAQRLYLGEDVRAQSRDVQSELSTLGALFDFVRRGAPDPREGPPIIEGTRDAVSRLADQRSLQATREGALPASGDFALRAIAQASGGRTVNPNAFFGVHTNPLATPYVGRPGGPLAAWIDDLHEATRASALMGVSPVLARSPAESDEEYSARVDPHGTLSGVPWSNTRSPWVQRVSSLCHSHNEGASRLRMRPGPFASRQRSYANPMHYERFLTAVEHYVRHNPNAPRLPTMEDTPEKKFDEIVFFMRNAFLHPSQQRNALLH